MTWDFEEDFFVDGESINFWWNCIEGTFRLAVVNIELWTLAQQSAFCLGWFLLKTGHMGPCFCQYRSIFRITPLKVHSEIKSFKVLRRLFKKNCCCCNLAILNSHWKQKIPYENISASVYLFKIFKFFYWINCDLVFWARNL